MRVSRRAAALVLAVAAMAGIGAGAVVHEIRPSASFLGAPEASPAGDASSGTPVPAPGGSGSGSTSNHRSRLLGEPNLLASSDFPGLAITKNSVGEGEPQFQPPCLRRSMASTGATAVISAEYTEDDTITEIVGEFDNTPQATYGRRMITSWAASCRNDDDKEVAATASGPIPVLAGSDQGAWWRFPKDSNGWVDTVIVVQSGDRVAYLGLVDKAVTRAQAEALGATMARRLDD